MSDETVPAGLAAALADRYRLVSTLGRGATATVYLAEDLKHGRQVAIKVLDPELARAIGPERFEREIETAARLTHPNLMALFDSGEADGLLYYVMPHIAGESLRARLTREPQLPLEDALRIAREVADGLAHAHEHGLVHRDVKPENILLSSGHALLADFGISRALRTGESARGPTIVAGVTTLSGLSLGTPLYMAPEQFSASAAIDGRADVYSLGCVLYEMLAGEPPFGGSDVQSIQARHALDPVPPLRTRRPGVPDAVERAIVHALAKVPADRPADARRFGEELALAPRMAPAADPVPVPARTPPRRGALVAAGLAALAVALLGLVAWRAGWLDRLGGPGGATVPGNERRWVLLAAFDGPADDPSLAVAARDLVAAAIDESGAFASVPADQVRAALRLAGRPDTTRVAGDLARELAFRSSIPIVVEGAVHRVGGGYSTVLRAAEAETGRPVVTLTEAASDGTDLVPSLGRLAARLRTGLGEKAADLAHTRPLVEAATPSFEAYKAYLQARELLNAGDPVRARPLFRRALRLDGEFALAWVGLSTSFSNQGATDSTRWALDHADRHGDRLSEVQRLDAAAKRARLEFDLGTALASYERALKLDPSPSFRAALENNRGTTLEAAGRLEEALAAFDAASRVAPVEPTQVSLANKSNILVALRRAGEARAVLPRMRGLPLVEALFHLSILERNWERADSVAVAFADDPTMLPDERAYYLCGRSALLAFRGQWAGAEETLEAAHELARQAESSDAGNISAWHAILLAGLRGRPLPRTSPSPVRFMQAFFATFEGDSSRVRTGGRQMAQMLLETDLRPEFMAEIEGFLAFREERWVDAIRGLAPPARGSYRGGWIYDRIRNRARWTVATAFERTGQPDSAAVYLGLVLDPPRWSSATLVERPLYEPFVRGRLIRLALARGDVDQARAQWDELQRAMTQPDAEARRFLDETRDALALAGGMGSRERR